MSDSHIPQSARAAWLSLQIDHAFAGFRLQVGFTLRQPWTVLFGPSGSGKTTILRSIAGLFTPDSGQIFLQGEQCFARTSNHPCTTNQPPQARRVGLVTQAPALFPHHTVAENVAFALRRLPAAERRQKVQTLLHLLGAQEFQARLPRQISGGEQQRTALARTLAAGPRMLLLDEPFSAMDQGSRQQVLGSLQQWAREHAVPVLLVTHRLAEAFLASDEVVVLDGGKVVAQGMADRVLRSAREQLLAELGVTTADVPSGQSYSPER
ncbi:MAG: sulfate/molybdate ABC transporter ATP-binding protein [Acidobacteriaceae bacterium]